MYTIIVLLALFAHVFPQPLDARCCPCPDSGELSRAASCPCGDAAAAASTTTDTRSAAPKEDGKNLLEPEVTLAASMLDTLHEATEQEYRDALARDAARDVAALGALVRDVATLDGLTRDADPEESVRSVVVIMAPDSGPRDSVDEDDFLSGARHVQESRCIHPPASSLGNMRSSTNTLQILSDTLRVPKLKHNEFPDNNLLHMDSSVGASKADEIVDEKSFSRDQSTDFRFGDTKKQIMETEGHNLNSNFLSLKPKLGSLSNSGVGNLGTALKNMRLAGSNENKKPLIEYDKHPFNLRNILKLRDVELIPTSIRNKSLAKPKIDLSQFAIPTLFKKNEFHMNNDHEKKEATSNTDALRLSSKDESDDKDMKTGASESHDKISTQDNVGDCNDELTVNSLINSGVNYPASDQSREDTFSNDADNKELQVGQTEISAYKKSVPERTSAIDEILAKAACSDLSEYKEITSIEDSMIGENKNIFSKLEILENPDSMPTPVEIDATNIQSAQNHRQNLDSQDFAPVVKNPSEENTSPAIGETLTQFRENIVKQLENPNRPILKSELLQSMNAKSSNTNNQVKVMNGDLRSTPESIETDTAKADMASNASNVVNYHITGNDISMKDLQNMSDTLLESNPNNLGEDRSNLNLDGNNSSLSEDESRSKEIKGTGIPKGVANLCKIDSNKTFNNINDTEKSATDDSSVKEMDTGSSDMVIKTLPGILDSRNPNLKLRSPLFNNIALQPASESPLNLLGIPLDNVLSLNTNLPTIDDIRDRLSNIFNTKEDSSEDYEDVLSLETVATNDAPASRMDASASSRNTHKELPLLRKWEEFNNNIINAKPIALAPSDSLLDKHRFQLNSFRTHLPSPTTLELKPLKVEPIVSNKAKLSNPTSDFRTDKPKSLKLKPLSSAVDPWDSLSSLDLLRNSVRSNTNNIFDNLARPQLYPRNENLRTHDIDDVAKNIRLNTEKTVKGIQRKMKSALKRPALHNPLSNSLATPQDLLDDMNDKLKGLQYDFNDRLASLRESFLDSTRTKTLVDQPRKAANKNVMNNTRKPKVNTYDTTSRLRTSASAPMARVTFNNENTNQPRNYFNQDWSKLPEIQSSASESHLATKEMTKIRADILLPHPQRTSTSMTQNTFNVEDPRDEKLKSFLHREEYDDRITRRPLFKSATGSLLSSRQPKVTVSFGATPTPPATTSRARGSNAATADGASRVTSVADAAPSSAKLKPLRSSAPMPSSLDEEYEDSLNNFSYEETPSEDITFAAPVLRQMSNTKAPFKLEDNTEKIRITPTNRKGLLLQKSLPNKPTLAKSLASSDGESLKNFRKWSQNVESNTKSSKVIQAEQVDMLRSATEHNQLLEQPLKENVSYKCRLICTKEIK